MTDQLTKWTHLYSTKSSICYGRGIEGGHNTVVFEGPDRKANAEQFMTVSELVEGLKRARKYVYGYARDAQVKHEKELYRGDLDFVDAILAKIEDYTKNK